MAYLRICDKLNVIVIMILCVSLLIIAAVDVDHIRVYCNITMNMNDLKWATYMTTANIKLFLSFFIYIIAISVTIVFFFCCCIPCITMADDTTGFYANASKSIFGAMMFLSILGSLWWAGEAHSISCYVCECVPWNTPEYISLIVLSVATLIFAILLMVNVD